MSNERVEGTSWRGLGFNDDAWVPWPTQVRII